MEKNTMAMIAIGMLIIMQGVAWILNKDGAITATIFGLIGLIAGSIFGFTYNKGETK
jgi:uncharacterized membrane protein